VRSYEYPSAAITGSFINSLAIGQINASGTSHQPGIAPLAASGPSISICAVLTCLAVKTEDSSSPALSSLDSSGDTSDPNLPSLGSSGLDLLSLGS